MSTNDMPRVYRVAYALGTCSERLIDEVLMTERQADDMHDLLKVMGAREIEIEALQKEQPLTHAEALQWIRRDF